MVEETKQAMIARKISAGGGDPADRDGWLTEDLATPRVLLVTPLMMITHKTTNTTSTLNPDNKHHYLI